MTLASLLLLPLAGCGGKGPDAALHTYLERLARPLDTPVPELQVPTVPRMPQRRDLQLETVPGNLGALDFLALTGCEVQITIGKRNSSLGLMATPSQRLLLELEFLQLAPACITSLRAEGRDALANSLEQARQQKTAQLPTLIFNATLASHEYRKLWQVPQELGDYPAATSSSVLSALAAINAASGRWLAGDYRADNLDFEVQLSEVARGDGGALLKALALQAVALESGNAVLEQRLQQGPLCKGEFRPAAADIVRTVIEKYFIGTIQPWSAALGRRQHELLPPITHLEEQLGAVIPAAYRHWQQQRDTGLSSWTRAPRDHVAALQNLLDSCEPA